MRYIIVQWNNDKKNVKHTFILTISILNEKVNTTYKKLMTIHILSIDSNIVLFKNY